MGATNAKAAPTMEKLAAMKKTARKATKKAVATKMKVAPAAIALEKPTDDQNTDKRSHQKYVPLFNIPIYFYTIFYHRKASVQHVQNDAVAEEHTEKDKTQ
jgi:hypothetical protein